MPGEHPAADLPEIFADALALAGEARREFLDHACRDRPDLRMELESLLATHRDAGDFLFTGLGASSAAGPAITGAEPAIPETVGPYRIVRLIASGGMGAVYLGERTDDAFRKQVAIKLIRSGLAAPEVIERFRTERQVLADLEHPGIARLVDGGSTATGLPYLVMEYVDGVHLTRYCREYELDLDARLDLFLEICAAVQFAHRNLVIHRDLKPTNILVDRSGRVKLLDFGIARVLSPTAADVVADPTLTQLHPLTPRYASPEQVTGQRMTTATDIYSLGVVLYELLTGAAPYETGGKSPSAVADMIVRELPARPSERADPPRARRLAGDLDTIVLKALNKEPARRYSTVDEFAADIVRHRQGLPVVARPDTAAYRFSKFVSRNRLPLGAAALFVILLGAALIATANAYRDAAASRREAEWQAYTASLSAAQSSLLLNKIADATAHLEMAPSRLRGWEWRHLKARLDRSLYSFHAHPGGITRMAFSPSGDRFLTCSIDSTIAVWTDGSGRLERRLGPFSSEVESAAFVPRSDLLAAGLHDGSVLVIDRVTGRPRTLFPAGTPWAQVAVRPDGRELASGFFDGTVRVWDLASGSLRATFKTNEPIALIAWSPDARFLVGGDAGGLVALYDAGSFARVRNLRAHMRRIYSVAFSPDGSRLVTGSMDQTANVWDVAGGTLLSTFREHRATVTALAFNPRGDRVVSSGADNRLLIWDGASGQLVSELHGHVPDVSALAAHPAGSIIQTGDWGGEVKCWTWTTADVRAARTEPDRAFVPQFLDLALDPQESHMACASNNVLNLWTLSDGLPVHSHPCPPSQRVAFTPDGSRVVVGLQSGDILVMARDGAVIDSVAAHPAPLLGLAIAPGGAHVATSAADSTVKLWTLPGLRLERTYRGHQGEVHDVAYAPDGHLLASCGQDGTIQIWDPSSERRLAVLKGDGAALLDIAFDSRGERLASAGATGSVALWEVGDGQRPPQVLMQGAARMTAVAWSADGTRLAAGGSDDIVRVFEVASGRQALALHGHVGRITALRFTREDALLSASTDGTVRFWDAPR